MLAQDLATRPLAMSTGSWSFNFQISVINHLSLKNEALMWQLSYY